MRLLRFRKLRARVGVAFAVLLTTTSATLVDGCLEPPVAVADGGPEPFEASLAARALAESGPDSGDTALELADGGTVRGRVVATYDHATFWDASPEKTYAVFEQGRFGDYPDDRSLHFVSSLGLARPAGAVAPDTGFRDFLRKQNIVLFRSPLDGISFVIRGNDGYHLEENGYGHYAWDLEKVKSDGSRFRGAGVANEDYETWDAPVLLPTAGVVVEVERNGRDNVPGSYPPNAVNNMVGVWLGGHYYVYILHFRADTIPTDANATCAPAVPGVPCVKVGAWLPAGSYLGRAGNSGVSLEPHVHVTLLYYDVDTPTPRTWSIPGELSEAHVARSASGPSTLHEFAVPRTGDYISDRAF